MNPEVWIRICVRIPGWFGDFRKLKDYWFSLKMKFLMCVSQKVVASEINQN